MYLLRIQSVVGYKTLIMEVLSCRKEVNTKKNDVSGCLHLLTPRFSITALPKGKTVDSEYMIKFFHDTRHRFSNLRKNPVMFDEMILQVDNARPHTAVITRHYFAGMGLRLVYQSPYSPDLNLCDRFLSSDRFNTIVMMKL